VGFGAGIHACGGLLLARLEMQVALRILFQWLPEPAIDIHSL
jgi:cytochrome P450